MVQNSKIVEAISDTKEIAYNQGLEADITGTKQQVETLQLRLDSSNKHMHEITRQNEAMNSDFKQIGHTIEHNSKVMTENNQYINELINKMSRGLTVRTTDVAYDVAENFKRLTGTTIDELIDTNLSEQLAREYNKVQVANLNVQLLEESTRQSVDKLEETIHSFQKTFNLLLIELAFAIGIACVIPIWWGKVIALIGSVIVILKLNVWGDSDNED